MLAAGYPHQQVAEECGVTPRTLSRWKDKPDFQKLLRESSGRMFDSAIAELCLGAMEAARELRQIIADPEASQRVKVSAIQTLLTAASKAKESVLEQRLEALEAALDGDINS